MRISARKFAIALRVLILTPLLLAFQNCNQKLGTSTDVSGDMTQHIAIDLPQFKLEDLVKGYYENILGREPTAQELADGVALFRGGLSNQAFQQQLANSAEAIGKLTALLLQAFGNNGTHDLNYWITQLETGTSLDEIKKLLGITT